MKMLLATRNRNKIREMREILGELGIEVISQEEAGLNLDPEENGTTFEENAAIKAKAVAEASGMPAIADDSGLSVDALGGAPGVYSARYGGPGLDDTGRWQLLLENMRGEKNRACRYVCVICAAFPDGTTISARGECPGILMEAPQGTGGFGYDPVFYMPEYSRTMAEITSEEKNAVSHRAKAIWKFKTELEKTLNGTDE